MRWHGSGGRTSDKHRSPALVEEHLTQTMLRQAQHSGIFNDFIAQVRHALLHLVIMLQVISQRGQPFPGVGEPFIKPCPAQDAARAFMHHVAQPLLIEGLKHVGDDADFIRKDMERRGGVAMIPTKRNRLIPLPVDPAIYALRNIVERRFNKLKNARRLATRYDKTADSDLGFIHIVSIQLWMREFVNAS
jgi:transposase